MITLETARGMLPVRRRIGKSRAVLEYFRSYQKAFERSALRWSQK